MIKTVTIQIGNSDDKLSQLEWTRFIKQLQEVVGLSANQIHFSGHSNPGAEWQNACIVGVINEAELDCLVGRLRFLAERYRQDSIAFTVGETRFLAPHKPLTNCNNCGKGSHRVLYSGTPCPHCGHEPFTPRTTASKRP